MKRRKQLERDEALDSDPDDPMLKKTRSSRATSSPLAEDEGNESGGQAIKKRSSCKDAPEESASASIGSSVGSPDGEVEADEESDESASEHAEEVPEIVTPIKRPRGRPRKDAGNPSNANTPMKGLLNKKLFSTPSKANGDSDARDTPKIQRNANRSARRKSTSKLIENTILGQTSDNDDDEEEIAKQIYNSDIEEPENDEDNMEIDGVANSEPVTPSRKRGRPKGSKNKPRSPTPELNLPAHEKYFYQNRGGKPQTSNNTLSSLKLLDHEEYFSRSRKLQDHHEKALKNLEDIHSDQFDLWQFELSQDFNLCLYGFGSKRSLLLKFADHVYKSQENPAKAKIVVVNGYVNTLTIRDILKTVASAVSETVIKSIAPTDMLESVFALLEEDNSQHVTLIVHSIDALPLRRPATQTLLSRLCSHSQVHLVASADHPNFPLLWDSSLRSAYNFCFHDCTTFQPHSVEYDVVDEVNELLGRSGRRVGGKEGVSFVLKSLPENAKNLFRVLIGEQLASMDEHMAEEGDDDDDDEHRLGAPKRSEPGVEYRVLYQKAVEEFICSNEMNFRTLLKEFHDHQMIQSRKDALGTEMLSVPFRREELETILEDIMS